MADAMDPVPSYCRKSTLILGCGNVLLGDDGFGPEVAACLEDRYPVPKHVGVLDAGTGVRDILLDLSLSRERPKRVVLVDAVDGGRPAGTISTPSLDSLPKRKVRDISPHLAPTSSLLMELKDLRMVDVFLVTVQPTRLPGKVQPGLSRPVREAVPRACELIARSFFHHA